MKKAPKITRTFGQNAAFNVALVFTFTVQEIIFHFTKMWMYRFIHSLPDGVQLLALGVIIVIPMLVIMLGTIWFLYYMKYPQKVDLYRAQKKMMKENARLDALRLQKQEEKVLAQKARLSYTISKILPSNEPLVLNVELVEAIDRLLSPIVKINGTPIGTKILSDNVMACHIKKAITAEMKKIIISIGHSIQEIDNPFFMPAGVRHHILWQCEGHGYERKILLPGNYFPQAITDIYYQFTLKIHGMSYGNFLGMLDPNEEMIVIPIGKEISKAQCTGKEVTLSVTYGKGNKITLPEPVVMVKDGATVLN